MWMPKEAIMSINRPENDLLGILTELRKLPRETEWVEFKHNNAEPDEIGQYLSALANAAALAGKVHAWMLWGMSNDSHEIIGTTFNPVSAKVGNEELESWLLRLLSPKINFRFYTFLAEGESVVLLEIGAAFRHPVQFKGVEYIRIGSYKKGPSQNLMGRSPANYCTFRLPCRASRSKTGFGFGSFRSCGAHGPRP